MPRPPAPHGTPAAHRRHQRWGETPCGPCKEAIRLLSESRRRARGVRPRGPLQPCGTPAAYVRHLRHGEVPDQACTDAVAAYYRDRKAASPTT